MSTKQDLADKIRVAVISCPHTIDNNSIHLRYDHRKDGINASNQLFRRIDAVVETFEGFEEHDQKDAADGVANAVLAEIARLRPHYQSEISHVDAGRRQMLDHLEKFILNIPGVESAPNELVSAP